VSIGAHHPGLLGSINPAREVDHLLGGMDASVRPTRTGNAYTLISYFTKRFFKRRLKRGY
jgi:hypothetical protein